MNMDGHLFVTERVIPEKFASFCYWIKLGSILPDILPHTRLMGHTWEASFEKIIKKMENLEIFGSYNIISSIYLGYLLHFIEDYFTFPHNTHFKENLKEHILYEREFTQHLKEEFANKCHYMTDEKKIQISDLKKYLMELHEVYMQEKCRMETDRQYIMRASENVMLCFESVFDKNMKYYQELELEALRINTRSYI